MISMDCPELRLPSSQDIARKLPPLPTTVEVLTVRQQENLLGPYSIRSDIGGLWHSLLKDRLDKGVPEYTLYAPWEASLQDLPNAPWLLFKRETAKGVKLPKSDPSSYSCRVSQEQSLPELDPTSAFQQPHLHSRPLRKILSCLGRLRLMPLILGHTILDRFLPQMTEQNPMTMRSLLLPLQQSRSPRCRVGEESGIKTKLLDDLQWRLKMRGMLSSGAFSRDS
ncbi:hypothetical protein VNO77_14916 [Canavalia gladiata]|uniref:Uncharacterized protein n=1 Tax=Canavalia gladiata TaxID=3824 RepID=A0AAN9QNX7_CANGL